MDTQYTALTSNLLTDISIPFDWPTSPGLPNVGPWGADALSAADGDLASTLWRQAVHDLRGKLGVVTNITALLQRPVSDARRSELIALLDRNVSGLRILLDGVADLARLDAAQEAPVIHTVDIAAVLHETCDSVADLAGSRGLHVEFKGPASLLAESDALMVGRIAQNLMLNAIKYTTSSGVILTCGACDDDAAGNWYFDICDNVGGPADGTGDEAPQASIAAASPPGEGIGLSIVGRLCHLLGGTVQMESSAAGRSTRVRLPRRWGVPLEALTIAAMGPGRRAPCTIACVPVGLKACNVLQERGTVRGGGPGRGWGQRAAVEGPAPGNGATAGQG